MARQFKPYSRTQNLKLSTFINGQIVYFNSLQERYAYEAISAGGGDEHGHNEDQFMPVYIEQDGDYIPMEGEPMIMAPGASQDFAVAGGLPVVRFAFENGGTLSTGDYIFGYYDGVSPTSGVSQTAYVYNQTFCRIQGNVFIDTAGQNIGIRNNGTAGGSQGRKHVYGGPHPTHTTVGIPGEFVENSLETGNSFKTVRKRQGYCWW